MINDPDTNPTTQDGLPDELRSALIQQCLGGVFITRSMSGAVECFGFLFRAEEVPNVDGRH
jgi:hypothetical protein